jgi:uncharacterized protein involved in type VI secretion and phage assembly
VSVGARAHAHDRKHYGVYTAVVSKNEDKGQQGRVKLHFPWFDDGQTESDWVRVAQLYVGGGGKVGALFVPEVGDEVLVAFEHGDMKVPYVLGGLYNGKDKAPAERSSSKDVKLIHTKAGHEITLDDSSGAQRVRIKTAGGQMVDLDDSGTKITLSTGKGAELVLDGANVTIKATQLKLAGTQIELGDGAAQAVPLGTQLVSLLAAHTHPTSAPGAPTGPPLPPITPALLSTAVKTK